MDGSLVAAMISLCLSASQVGGLCPLPGGWSKITPPAAATAYIRSQEAAQQAQARREQEAQEMAQKKAEEEAQKAAQEEAKKAEEAAQQADFDYEAIAASFPQTPLQTSSMVRMMKRAGGFSAMKQRRRPQRKTIFVFWIMTPIIWEIPPKRSFTSPLMKDMKTGIPLRYWIF